MIERPILFSAPMIRALLAGTKTQTRRAVRVQPSARVGAAQVAAGLWAWLRGDDGSIESLILGKGRCPFGQPGDRLWVRETWCKGCAHEDDDSVCIAYRASQGPNDGPASSLLVNNIPRPEGVALWKDSDEVWRPSIFMPRWASRILLEVTDVRVERLQDISEADAAAEGVEQYGTGKDGGLRSINKTWRAYGHEDTQHAVSAHASYRSLWNAINGANSWDANPWVWAVSFRRV